MYVVCKDHLELAIDKFVDDYEEAPDIYELDKLSFSAWGPPAHCDECEAAPRFLVI